MSREPSLRRASEGRGCTRKVILLVTLLAGGGALLAVAAGVIFWRAQDRARARQTPPLVVLTQPDEAPSVAPGAILQVAATAYGTTPILRAELWVNGSLVATQTSPHTTGISPFSAFFELPVADEPIAAAVRAVDQAGLVGQSPLLRIVPSPAAEPGNVAFAAVASEGETLADVAARFEADPAAVRAANPGIGDQGLAGGTLVGIPGSPEEGPPDPAASAPGSADDAVQVPGTPMLEVAGTVPLWSYLVVGPPDAPEGLRAQSQGCDITLAWMDRASNEAAYEVWYAGMETAPHRLAELTPAAGGSAWVRLSAPGPGFLTFWVEAVNLIGRQPSNVDTVSVDANCPSASPPQFRIEALGMKMNSGYDRGYCYVSFEGAPEIRVPQVEGEFFEVRAGRAEVGAASADHRTWAMPVPADGSLELSGECWGWRGEDLDKLGDFQHSFAAEAWDGSKVILEGDAFQIDLVMAMASTGGGTGILKTYGNDNPTAPRITDLHVERSPDPYCQQDCYELVWTWQGEKLPTQVMEVSVYMAVDGNPAWMRQNLHAQVGVNRLVVPATDNWCGKMLQFDVTQEILGTSVRAQGKTSYAMPRCPYRVRVTFDALDLPWTGDGWNAGPCDTIDVYYWIGVNDQTKSFWGGCSFNTGCFLKPLSCGRYTFADLAAGSGDAYPDTFTVVIPQAVNRVDLTISTMFSDYDWGYAGDDSFAPFLEHYSSPSFQAAEQELGCDGKTFLTDLHVNDTADSRLQYTISIFPNPCTAPGYRP
ncbi:MAG TPA: hypothetical protein VFI11_07540 [Anaerolineales bacterium]|nr:hypothetical protein [Anaerolineales bacterium]